MGGAAKTSAYYAVSSFVGALMVFVINGEKLITMYFIGLLLMCIGTAFVVYDTMYKYQVHGHTHTIVHTHSGRTHTHIITHEHNHGNFST